MTYRKCSRCDAHILWEGIGWEVIVRQGSKTLKADFYCRYCAMKLPIASVE